MKNVVLMKNEEPTDKELVFLMHEVAIEAKRKAQIAKEQLSNRIVELINKAKENSNDI